MDPLRDPRRWRTEYSRAFTPYLSYEVRPAFGGFPRDFAAETPSFPPLRRCKTADAPASPTIWYTGFLEHMRAGGRDEVGATLIYRGD